MLAARIVAAVVALGTCVVLPAIAGGDDRQGAVRAFELRIAGRRVPPAQRVLRAAEGERVELHWSADEPLVLHLHGYDIETRIAPGQLAVTVFAARLTGRFPVEIHGERGQHSGVLLHVEIYPR